MQTTIVCFALVNENNNNLICNLDYTCNISANSIKTLNSINYLLKVDAAQNLET